MSPWHELIGIHHNPLKIGINYCKIEMGLFTSAQNTAGTCQQYKSPWHDLMGIRLSPLCRFVPRRAVTLPTSPANIDRILGHNSRCNDEDWDVKNGDIDCPEERWSGLVIGTDIVVTMQAGRGCRCAVDTHSRGLK